MKLFNVVIPYLAMAFNLYAFLKAYSATTNNKIKFTKLNILIFLCSALIIYAANNFTNVPFKVATSLSILMIVFKSFFHEDMITRMFKTFVIYLIILLCDFLASTVFLFFPIHSVIDLGKITFLRDLVTILDSLLLMLVFLIKRFNRFLNKLFGYITSNKNVITLVLLIFSFVVYFVVALYASLTFNPKIFFMSILLMSFFLLLSFVMIYQYFKNKESLSEQQALLDLMNEYEKILENERINRHEMLNNLIILKSYKIKSSKEYEDTLDEIINQYQGNKSKIYSNLYKLPSGIKGIIYYKMENIKKTNLNFELIMSSRIKDNFEKLNRKVYFKLCKVLGIVLDNSIEAAALTIDKLLLIDIYLEDNDLIIYIENSFINNIDLNLISKKGFSSKGENRGFGLYIVNKILEDSEFLDFNQYIENNKFITIVKIKNPSN